MTEIVVDLMTLLNAGLICLFPVLYVVEMYRTLGDERRGCGWRDN